MAQGQDRRPAVKISGKCAPGDSCQFKVKAQDVTEASALSIEGLRDAIDQVTKSHATAPRTSPRTTFAIGPVSQTRYSFEWDLVDAGQLVTSNHPDTFQPNPQYPSALQPRDRTRAANREQVLTIATGLDPDQLLTDFRSLDRGAPIVGADNVVESGNGRAMALMLAYAGQTQALQDSAARYKSELVSRASEFGLDPDDVAAMSAPVLVRRRLSDVDRQAFAEEANASAILQPSTLEWVRQNRDSWTVQQLQALQVAEGVSIEEALTQAQNRDVVRAWLSQFSANERAPMVDDEGRLNQEGVRRAAMTAFAFAFEGEAGLRLAGLFFESTDNNVRNVGIGIMASLGSLATAEGLVRDGARPDSLSIGEDLARSIDVFSVLRREGMSVEDYLAQGQLFERQLTPFQEQVLRDISERGRSGKRIGQVLRNYADRVISSPDTRQAGLLDLDPVNKEDLWELATLEESQARTGAAATLFQGLPSCTRPKARKVESCIRQVKASGGGNPFAVCQDSIGCSIS